MRYYAREVEQADRESKKARFVAPENTQEELPPNSGGPSSSSTLWKPLGKRSGEEELGGTRPQKIMKEVQREPSRSQKRERDGDEAEDERPDRYQAVQEDNKEIVMEEVKSFNKVAFEINQEVRDERMNRLLINNPNTDECWNINAKKSRWQKRSSTWTSGSHIFFIWSQTRGVMCKPRFDWHRCIGNMTGTS